MKGIKGFQKNHPNYNKGKPTFVTCDNCQKDIKIKRFALKWKTHFCNQQCKSHFMIGHKMSEHNKLKLKTANTGRIPSIETKIKISLANKGEKNGNWMGGFKKGPSAYNYEFSDALKEKIKERDNHICQLCFDKDNDFLNIHHIDYNKKNNNDSNLITLCHSCHSKTNIKNRGMWSMFFLGIMFEKYKHIKEAIKYDKIEKMQVY